MRGVSASCGGSPHAQASPRASADSHRVVPNGVNPVCGTGQGGPPSWMGAMGRSVWVRFMFLFQFPSTQQASVKRSPRTTGRRAAGGWARAPEDPGLCPRGAQSPDPCPVQLIPRSEDGD